MCNQGLFETIQAQHTEKPIVSMCKKLIKKCSFNSGADIQNLCHLAYWLYVYGYEDDALLVCETTHDADYPGKGGFNVWDFIIYMWGLEAHIMKCRNLTEEAAERIKKMDDLWLLTSTAPEHEEARRNRFTVDSCSYEKEISNAATSSAANRWRFLALFKLIGYGTTGLFPNLEANKSAVNALVEQYVSLLK